MKYISPEYVQNTGSNVYNLAKLLANIKEIPKTTQEMEKLVFFDFLGLFVVSYSGSFVMFVHMIVPLAAVLLPILFLSIRNSAKTCSLILKTIVSFVSLIVSLVLAVKAMNGLAFIFEKLGKSMFW